MPLGEELKNCGTIHCLNGEAFCFVPPGDAADADTLQLPGSGAPDHRRGAVQPRQQPRHTAQQHQDQQQPGMSTHLCCITTQLLEIVWFSFPLFDMLICKPL